jgi:hypothetical protein
MVVHKTEQGSAQRLTGWPTGNTSDAYIGDHLVG